MDDHHKEEFRKKMDALNDIEQDYEDILNENQQIIEKASNINQEIIKQKKYTHFFKSGYEKITDSDLDDLDETQYSDFISPLNIVCENSTTIKKLKNDLKERNEEYAIFLSTASSSTSIASAGSAITASNALFLHPFSKTVWSVTEYKKIVEPEENIKYLKQELPKLNPDISADFNHFLNIYHSSQANKQKYQELIGARTMFFLKLICPSGEKYLQSGEKTRKDKIYRFVFGNYTIIGYDSIIDSAKKLWNELSDQEPISGYSVKVGNVSSDYVEVLFNKILSIMASLVKLRIQYFKN